MRYRHFRNTDPPAIVGLWNESLRSRGAAELRSPAPFESLVLNKPYFDPQGITIAEVDGQVVGFSHVGFGATPDGNDLDRSLAVISAVLVHPDWRRRKVGTELLRRAESYALEHGSSSFLAGAFKPQKPFYVGLYGGSNAAGFLKSGPEAEPFFLAAGYSPDRQSYSFERRLEAPLNIVDPRFTALRKRYEAHTIPQARLSTWWRECVFGPLEPSDFRLDDRHSGQTVARALFWEMKEFGWRWGGPAAGIIDVQVRSEMRRQGVGKFLLAQLLRHLQEQYFAIVEVQTMADDETGRKMFKSLGFTRVDEGTSYVKIANRPS